MSGVSCAQSVDLSLLTGTGRVSALRFAAGEPHPVPGGRAGAGEFASVDCSAVTWGVITASSHGKD